jgi:uncharacterized membrane protein
MGAWLTETRLKWILAISLIVNIFLIGAAVGAGLVVKHHLRDFQRPLAMQKAWRNATEGTTREERHHIYLLTKAAALSGEADMEKARALRAQARALVSQEPYDAAQIAMLSEQARSAENDARGKIENALILNMKDLPVRERTFMLTTLLRASGRFDRFIEKDDKPPVKVEAAAK